MLQKRLILHMFRYLRHLIRSAKQAYWSARRPSAALLHSRGRFSRLRPRMPSSVMKKSTVVAGRLGDLYRCARRWPPSQYRITRVVAWCAQASPALRCHRSG